VKGAMNKTMIILSVVTILLIPGCVQKKTSNSETDYVSKNTERIKKLVVNGPRPKENVIYNLTPINHFLQQRWLNEAHADLAGKLIITLSIDKIGDIGLLKYEHTMKDSAYIDQLVQSFYMYSFDPWNDQIGITEVECTIEFIKVAQ
jgi:hypothetical protein